MTSKSPEIVRVEGLVPSAKVWEMMAQFGKPPDKVAIEYLTSRGLADSRTRSVGCLGWIWSQWLQGTAADVVTRSVVPFVARGMEMQNASPLSDYRGLSDLFLLHCAIFGAGKENILALAGAVVDSSGYHGETPKDNGDLYVSAWAGMIKHWILGNRERAVMESESIWGAYKDVSCRAATKPLVAAWLKADWKAFRAQQEKDFDKQWARARKDGTVLSSTEKEAVVNLDSISSLPQLWCWAHCGLALLAYREGVEVATDPFWFPPHALKCVDSLK